MGVVSIIDKMRENRLRWFGYVMRREDSEAVRIVMGLSIEGKRGRGKSKKWLKRIKCDMRTAGMNDMGDRIK